MHRHLKAVYAWEVFDLIKFWWDFCNNPSVGSTHLCVDVSHPLSLSQDDALGRSPLSAFQTTEHVPYVNIFLGYPCRHGCKTARFPAAVGWDGGISGWHKEGSSGERHCGDGSFAHQVGFLICSTPLSMQQVYRLYIHTTLKMCTPALFPNDSASEYQTSAYMFGYAWLVVRSGHIPRGCSRFVITGWFWYACASHKYHCCQAETVNPSQRIIFHFDIIHTSILSLRVIAPGLHMTLGLGTVSQGLRLPHDSWD